MSMSKISPFSSLYQPRNLLPTFIPILILVPSLCLLIAGMKDVTEAQIGDTLYLHNHPVEPLPGFKSAKPMVFAGEELPN